MKRTLLPLNGLRVFDAAARHLSFTRAADELAVTPAAVGQHIRALEEVLGVVLFRRAPKGLELTPEGEAGLEELRKGFLNFEEAVRAMQAGQSSKSLTIAAPRDVTAKWLAGALAAYRERDPELKITILASDDGLDFTEANLDLAVIFADGAGEHEGLSLGITEWVSIMAPGYEGEGRIAWPGAPGAEAAATLVADAGLAVDAAAAGLGRAVVPSLLAQGEIASGRVVSSKVETKCTVSYWLVAPLPQWRQKKIRELIQWIKDTY